MAQKMEQGRQSSRWIMDSVQTVLMDTEAQKRAEAAFAKKDRQRAEANSAWAEYHDEQAAIDANTERLRALRLARDAEAATAKPATANGSPTAAVRKKRLKVIR